MPRSVAVDIIHHHLAPGPAYNESEEMNQALAQDLTSGQLLSTLTWVNIQTENLFLGPFFLNLRPLLEQKWHFDRNMTKTSVQKKVN